MALRTGLVLSAIWFRPFVDSVRAAAVYRREISLAIGGLTAQEIAWGYFGLS